MHEPESAITPRTYLTVFISLMVLLVVTVGVAALHLGPLALLVALTIAFIKALLVILYFMHGKESEHVVQLYAAAGLLWLAILLALTFSDYLTRV